MVVLVGAVVVGAVVVGGVLTVVVGAGATGSVLVVEVADGDSAVLVVVTGAGVVVDVELGVEPPPSLLSSTIPKITSASKAATSTPNPISIRAAGLRCHGVDPGSDSLGCCPYPPSSP
jgi:hypothetical protein